MRNTALPAHSISELTERLSACATLSDALLVGLEATIDLLKADYRNVQLYQAGDLVIACQRGFREPFLKVFARVSVEKDCACGRAMREGRSVVIADVETDAEFGPFRAFAAEAGYRAVQSTPLLTNSGHFVGMISTHFAKPHAPMKEEMGAVVDYATQLADAVQRFTAASLAQ
jgi:GAF domain-containing protein